MKGEKTHLAVEPVLVDDAKLLSAFARAHGVDVRLMRDCALELHQQDEIECLVENQVLLGPEAVGHAFQDDLGRLSPELPRRTAVLLSALAPSARRSCSPYYISVFGAAVVHIVCSLVAGREGGSDEQAQTR